jgi:protein-S-isoprenylcysteine O-methyltransferase Ste14
MPVVYEGGAPEVIFWTLLIGWVVAETAFAMRTTLRDPEVRDSSTFILAFVLYGGIAAGIVVADSESRSSLPGPDWWPPIAGLVIYAAGAAIRIWAIRTLGRFFRYVVVTDEDHVVIDTGPYRLVRHPSYTGLMMIALAIGVALDGWLALALCFVPGFIGFTIRLLSEERTLVRELGQPYVEYMERTKRLIPHVW